MKKTRIWLMLLAAATFAASLSSLYVHYHLLTDPGYTSFCDVSESVSCEAVYESEYGTIRGVPVAAGGAIWGALVFLLAARGLRNPKSPTAVNVAEYIFVLSVIGLAAVLYFAYASFFVLDTVCLLCLTTYVTVFAIFFIASGVTSVPFRTLPGRFIGDIRGLARNPGALALGLLWVAASAAVIVFFPREHSAAAISEAAPAAADASPVGSTAGQPAAPPARPSLSELQRQQFEQWYSSQPYVPISVPSEGAAVLIVKFNDYQCPPCRNTYMLYNPIFARYQQSHPGKVRFVTRDFPLEAECNSGGPHAVACEAAAAVRMARAVNKAHEMEEWLFANQSPGMTLDRLKEGLREAAGVTDFDAQYPKLLPLVKADVAYGQKVGVSSTPTFFINGRRIQGGIEPALLEAAIEYELGRAKSAAP